MSPRRRTSKAIAYALEGTGRIPVVIEGCGHMHSDDVKQAGACASCGWLSGEHDAPTAAPPLDYYPRKDGG